MSETQLSNDSQDEAKGASKRTGSKPGNSLKNKISAIKEKAKKEIADLKDAQVPIKKEIRSKAYEINRRTKAVNLAIEQNLALIAELKDNPAESLIPAKHAIKIKKLDNQNNAAVIKVYEDIILDFNKTIDDLDRQFDEKIALINAKAEKQIEAERKNAIQRKQNQAAKAKVKTQAAAKAKREARKQAKEQERESGLAVLRQHLPMSQDAPITDVAQLPKELSELSVVLNEKFQIVNDTALVSKVVQAKSANKYFSMIRQAMADVIGIPPTDLLLVSFDKVGENVYDLTLHSFKDTQIERLATQYGFVKKPRLSNRILPINLNPEQKEAVLKDMDMFLTDLWKLRICTYIFDATHNALFKAV